MGTSVGDNLFRDLAVAKEQGMRTLPGVGSVGNRMGEGTMDRLRAVDKSLVGWSVWIGLGGVEVCVFRGSERECRMLMGDRCGFVELRNGVGQSVVMRFA